MQVTKTAISSTQVKLTVTPTAEELKQIKNHVLGHFKNKVKLSGFRQGTAPLHLIEKNVDPNLFQAEFLDEALNQLYTQALRETDIRPVERPEVQIIKFVPYTTLEFSAEVPVIGEVKLPDYKKIKLEKPVIEVSSNDIKEVLVSLQKRLADKKDVDRAAKDGDQVYVDFKGVDENGKAINGAEGKDYPLILGSNSFIPGFETNLIGLKAGQEKTFTITFPKDYGVSAVANKKVTFTVTVIKVQEVIEPKLDDDFAAKAGPFKTLADLKADIKNQLKHERTHEAQRNYESELVKKIADKSSVDIPDVLLKEQVDRSLRDLQQNLMYRGQTFQEFLEAEGKTEEEYRESLKPQAKERVKAGLVLSEIAEKEGLTVTPEELEVRIQLLKGQYQDKAMQAELDKPENHQDIAARLLTEKTLARLLEYTS